MNTRLFRFIYDNWLSKMLMLLAALTVVLLFVCCALSPEDGVAHAQYQQTPDSIAEQLYNEGNAYFKAGRYQDAMQSYKMALEYSKDSYRLYFNLAMTHIKLGHKVEAEKSLERCLQLRPNDSDAANELKMLRSSPGQPQVTTSPEEKKTFLESAAKIAENCGPYDTGRFVVYLRQAVPTGMTTTATVDIVNPTSETLFIAINSAASPPVVNDDRGDSLSVGNPHGITKVDARRNSTNENDYTRIAPRQKLTIALSGNYHPRGFGSKVTLNVEFICLVNGRAMTIPASPCLIRGN
jgi:tetratricopeptide (TPR) repeat protein